MIKNKGYYISPGTKIQESRFQYIYWQFQAILFLDENVFTSNIKTVKDGTSISFTRNDFTDEKRTLYPYHVENDVLSYKVHVGLSSEYELSWQLLSKYKFRNGNGTVFQYVPFA